MTATPTFFTVLTPTYNRAGTLHRVYESLSRQTYRDFEWVIVDDGSTDNTHEAVLDWQQRAAFPIRYVWQNNQHKKTAFNRGVREARGELVVALDSDDEMPPEALATFKAAWDAIPPARRDSYVAITGLCARPDGSIVGDRYPQDVFDSTAVDVYFRYRIKGEKFGCMRTDILRKFPFPEDVAGFVPESLVWWAIARAGYLSRFINQVVRTYHDTPGGLSQGGGLGAQQRPGPVPAGLGHVAAPPGILPLPAARIHRGRRALHALPAAPEALGRADGVAGLPPDKPVGAVDGGRDVAAGLCAVPPRPAARRCLSTREMPARGGPAPVRLAAATPTPPWRAPTPGTPRPRAGPPPPARPGLPG